MKAQESLERSSRNISVAISFINCLKGFIAGIDFANSQKK